LPDEDKIQLELTQRLESLAKEIDWSAFAQLATEAAENIAKGKVSILKGKAADFEFAYTVGRAFHGEPELLLSFPVDSRRDREILLEIIGIGQAFVDGRPIHLTDRLLVVPKAIIDEAAQMNLTVAYMLHKMATESDAGPPPIAVPPMSPDAPSRFAALQLVFSDDEGRFPWDPQHEALLEQPKFWRDKSLEAHLS
jgi:hypothetical protein